MYSYSIDQRDIKMYVYDLSKNYMDQIVEHAIINNLINHERYIIR